MAREGREGRTGSDMDLNKLSSEVYAYLRNAASQDLELLKSAENKLKSFEILPGFHFLLLRIIRDYDSSATAVRWQAVLYLKNGVERCWRRGNVDTTRINEEEKVNIRKGLLDCFSEPVSSIALQLAVLIGKIARMEKEWSELLPTLTDRVQSQDNLIQHRALLFLYYTIKDLSTKRLPADRHNFLIIVEQILPFVVRLWMVHHSNFLHQVSMSESQETMFALEKSILALKLFRKSIVHGLNDLNKNEDALKVISSIHAQARLVLDVRRSRGSCELLEKYAVLHMKILNDVLERHPFSFLPFLKPTLEFVCSLCFTKEGQAYVFQRFVIFCLNFLKQVLLCTDYRLPKPIEKASEPTLLSHRIKGEFFAPPTVTEICQRLISEYLPLSADDLNHWDQDPEEYACEDGGDSWKYSYRPCCETVFLAFFHEFREMLAPVLTNLVRELSLNPTPPSDLPAILYKDSVYNAIGLAAFDLYGEVDFDNWLVSGLEQELTVGSSNYRIIRKRVVWLIGRWSGVKLSPDLRPKLYQILLPLLRPEEDLVVRLTTCKSLKVVIDDFEFSCKELEPYLGAFFQELFKLLKEVQECDTKLCVLNVLSYMIERMGVSIRPYCDELLNYLPSLWDASIDHNMLRCSLLTTLVYIVQGLGTICESLFPSFIGPIIQFSTGLKDTSYVYLLEDGLELWLTVLNNTKEISEPLSALARNLPPLLELGSENLRTILYIVNAYILISPVEFINNLGERISSALYAMYFDLREEGVIMILHLVELVLKAGPPSSPLIFKDLIISSLKATCKNKDYPTSKTADLCILSRLILNYPKEFGDFMLCISRDLNVSPDIVTGNILDSWLEKMPNITQHEHRKLLALAMCSLLTSGSPAVMERIFIIFINITEALNDVTRPDSIGGYVDTLVMNNPCQIDDDNGDYETEHEVRKLRLASCDSVHSVDLREYFQAQINCLNQQIGQTKYLDLIENIDYETKANMKEFVTI